MRTTALMASTALAAALFLPHVGWAAEKCNVMVGGNENPPVVSDGTGRFHANIDNDGTIRYRLRYEFPDDTVVLQAHIHIANPSINGAIAAFLCTNVGGSPEPVPECGSPSDDIRDTIEAADVLPVAGILDELADPLAGLGKLIEDGATYVNVHTGDFTGGEIRCQINERRR